MGVGVGAASTTPKRSFDGGSHSSSQLKVLVDNAERRYCTGCRLRSNRESGARLTLKRLELFDRDLDGDTATMCAQVAVQTAVATEHHTRRQRVPPKSNQIGDSET